MTPAMTGTRPFHLDRRARGSRAGRPRRWKTTSLVEPSTKRPWHAALDQVFEHPRVGRIVDAEVGVERGDDGGHDAEEFGHDGSFSCQFSSARGSKASRRPSPMKLMASTASTSAAPGNSHCQGILLEHRGGAGGVQHVAPARRGRRRRRGRGRRGRPRAGWRWRPAAWRRRRGCRCEFGRPWRKSRCPSPAPMPREAMTKSRSRSSSRRARIMRDSTGQESSEMTTIGRTRCRSRRSRRARAGRSPAAGSWRGRPSAWRWRRPSGRRRPRWRRRGSR